MASPNQRNERKVNRRAPPFWRKARHTLTGDITGTHSFSQSQYCGTRLEKIKVGPMKRPFPYTRAFHPIYDNVSYMNS
jgi:hypothetical protein